MPEDNTTSSALTQEQVSDLEPNGPAFQPVSPEEAPAAIEALLFAAGDPLTLDQLHRILLISKDSLKQTLDELKDRYARDRNRGILLREADGSYTLSTKPGMTDVLARLFSPRHRPPLTTAAYETLAVIAYNQPVTRSQIEAVRGVNSDNILARLIERNLIREVGTLDAPGRPALFSTTDQFLLDFGLRSVADLPPMEMLMYGTLQDIEHSLEKTATRQDDNQVTIDQIVAAIVPPVPDDDSATGEPLDETDTGVSDQTPDENDEAVLRISSAFFGSDDLDDRHP